MSAGRNIGLQPGCEKLIPEQVYEAGVRVEVAARQLARHLATSTGRCEDVAESALASLEQALRLLDRAGVEAPR